MLLASWGIGLVLIKFLVANLGAVLEFMLNLLDSITSFVLGETTGALFGRLTRLVVVATLIYLGLRKLLGKDSLPIKWFGGLARFVVKQVPQVIRLTVMTIHRLVIGSPAPIARRSRRTRD